MRLSSEREAIRSKELEPLPSLADSTYENTLREYQQFAERQKTGKLVIRSHEREFRQQRQDYSKHYLSPLYEDTALSGNMWRLFVQEIKTHSGKHRHQGGVCIFILEGRGGTEVDGLTLEWEAGDLVLLPIKYNGVEHKHFNFDPGRPCRWLALIYLPFSRALAGDMAQLELSPQFIERFGNREELLTGTVENVRTPGRPGGRVPGELRDKLGQWRPVYDPAELSRENLYEKLVALRDAELERRRHAMWLIKGSELPWESNRHGRMRWYLHPALAYTALNTLMVYVQEIAGGGRSGRLRHPGDQVSYVLQGQGYSMINGARYEWSAGDLIMLPLLKHGSEFQHFNTDPTQPARLVVAEPNFVWTLGVDRGRAWEQLADAPEYVVQ